MQEIYAGVLQIFRNEFLEFCLNTIFVPFLFEWLVIDICQALDDKMLSYCDNVMTLLLKDLSSGDLPRFVKPSIFSCFGDVALAIGEHFEKYVPYAMPMMQGVAEVCAQIDVNDEETIEYGNQLKRIFEAYLAISLSEVSLRLTRNWLLRTPKDHYQIFAFGGGDVERIVNRIDESASFYCI
ncbi:importin subunit beta-1 [Tanacetum coccineum]